MLEELQLYCVCKLGHQGWRKRLLALVQWFDWYENFRAKWARHFYTDGCIRTRYEFFLRLEKSFFFLIIIIIIKIRNIFKLVSYWQKDTTFKNLKTKLYSLWGYPNLSLQGYQQQSFLLFYDEWVESWNWMIQITRSYMAIENFLYHVIDNGDSAKVNTKSKVKKRIIVSSVLSTRILFFYTIWMYFSTKFGILLHIFFHLKSFVLSRV